MIHAMQERGRITARVSHPIAEKLQEAADLCGATLNQFLVQAALEKAEKIIDRERTIRFTQDDAAMLIHLLDNPARPNAALMKAFERYKNKVDHGEFGNGTGDAA
jgi:uncharacterized protein (DUF1778 family)